MSEAKPLANLLGIIGGTGLYQMENLKIHERRDVDTPFGRASAPVTLGELQGRQLAFLPRHGSGHHLIPSEINYRANIWALKSVGVRQIVSVSATGSLAEEINPGDLAIPTQYFDWTRGKRAATFFGEGITAHVSTAKPSCPRLAMLLETAAHARDIRIHPARTYACVEGPRLGTQAESHFLRQAGCHLVGMTNVPEAFLAREAQLCYCTVAIATDYDCWLEDPSQHATVDKVIALYMANLDRVKEMLLALLQLPEPAAPCGCRQALQGAVMTPDSALDAKKKEYLDFLRE
jgi:5'-methylthioadenosine phosphorylase